MSHGTRGKAWRPRCPGAGLCGAAAFAPLFASAWFSFIRPFRTSAALDTWRFIGQPTGQGRDLIASDSETVFHQEWIGQTCAIKSAVNLYGHNCPAITLNSLHDIQSDIDGEDFPIGPFFDRSDAAELPPHVFNNGIV